jgi:hypothetical protein
MAYIDTLIIDAALELKGIVLIDGDLGHGLIGEDFDRLLCTHIILLLL